MKRRILWTLMCGLLALGGQAAAQELGDGRGIDHVASLVRLENFDAATSVWTDQLGFSLTPALLSPLGAKNRLVWFDDLGAKLYGTDAVASLTPGFMIEMVE